ncbi:MAG: hypothetical protein WDN45_04275 [Caulobacteraceae bacterium]
MCHGAGSEHVAHPASGNILNPARMDYVKANDTCIQCHSQGQPAGALPAADGRYYDWPVGYRVGLSLSDFWMLEPHKLGELTFTHFPDGTGHKNRMQGNDFTQSLMYARGVACFSCHHPHGSSNPAIPAPAGHRGLRHVPCRGRAQRSARRVAGSPHPPCGRQSGQPMRRLPHAQDRADGGQHQRVQPYLPLRHPRRRPTG